MRQIVGVAPAFTSRIIRSRPITDALWRFRLPFEFKRLDLPGLVLIQPRSFEDARGYFMETYRASDFEAAGITDAFVQSNMSFSSRGVLRGLHYQVAPHAQGKLVSVLEGEIFDVAVDVQPGSPTFGKWQGVTLTADSKSAVYVPGEYGHGFCVLSETARVSYLVTREFHPESERGLLWSDPELAIPWPVTAPLLSERDKAWPTLAALARA